MADAGTWGVLVIFGLTMCIAFWFILLATRQMHGEEFRQWENEIVEWKKSHPVWNILYMFPFPIGTIFTLVGPKFPKRQRIETENQGEMLQESENDEGYSPKNSIIGRE